MKRLCVVSLFLMLFYVTVFLGADEKDVINQSEVPTVKSLEKLLVDHKPINISRSGALLFDQVATGNNAFCSSQWDSVWPFEDRICDNFTVPYNAEVDSVVWWGGYWSYPSNSIIDFWIEIYPDSVGFSQPKQDAMYSERVGYTETSLVTYYQYEAVIPQFQAFAGETYWIQFMASLVFPPHWGNECSWPGNTPGWGDGQECYFKSDLYGYLQWTSATTVFGYPYESSFQIYSTSVSVSEENGKLPLVFGLLQNTLNPVRNGKTTISYTITKDGPIALKIYNSAGRFVKTLVDRNEDAGVKTVYWDGRDNNHRPVAAGVYFFRIQAEDRTATKKMVVVR